MSSAEHWQSRTELQLGKEKLEVLKASHVLVAGLGGVGGVAAEMLVRGGIGKLTIVDHDTVHPSNRNRQIIALSSTEGFYKADLFASRLLDINPELELVVKKTYLVDEAIPEILSFNYSYVVDAIDTLSPKVYFIVHCMERNQRVISSMGAGGKFDPAQVRVTDISESYQCRLAHYMRKRLHTLGIHSGFKVVFSAEPVPKEMVHLIEKETNKRSRVGTISYMPAVFGCFIAAEVIRDLIGKEKSAPGEDS
jgi:tRNA threonylcarbamoyladenosine dehydratase